MRGCQFHSAVATVGTSRASRAQMPCAPAHAPMHAREAGKGVLGGREGGWFLTDLESSLLVKSFSFASATCWNLLFVRVWCSG
ncbi:hypothetical protein CEXT_776781 [Caerostris extrusa]|uniref:Secreted protein n=1 Tax=Caerostris extrusa TaxID=172846 RepID=A0AAV4WIF2_CAEEX|nr:hypothetical protein CEXT_776781 [Caerostris extrusa]